VAKIVQQPEVTWRGKPVPQAFVRFSTHFHQDTFVINKTLEEAIAFAIGALSSKEQAELAAYLRKLLSGKYDESDLKGLMNRTPSGLFFKRGVRSMLEAALAQVEAAKR
jgi:hypothetical protein